MNKSSKGDFSDVKERWDDIREHFIVYEDFTKLLRIFDERRTK
jgi:hypothetical protein